MVRLLINTKVQHLQKGGTNFALIVNNVLLIVKSCCVMGFHDGGSCSEDPIYFFEKQLKDGLVYYNAVIQDVIIIVFLVML